MNHPTTLADGRYLLVKQLGEGGMAAVYRAYDQRLQVWRAVKILSAEYANKPKLRQRFEAEAQTMALLEHKHIVRVYDVGSDGQYAYIIMELVEGGSLVDWLEAHGEMPPRMAVDVTIEFCEGIAAAHAKNVIHRDIKPHNVLVNRDGTCRVSDFGIAQVNTADQAQTKTGAVMGTWGYMAPEQRTNSKGVDERADVYSSAASLFTLLTNRMPMDLFASDRDDSMLEGVADPIIPVLVKATEYRREDRYPTILDFAAALRDIRGSLPDNPLDTPPLAKDPGEPPPTPQPEDYGVTRFGATAPAVGRRTTAGTIVANDVSPTTRGTIVSDDRGLHAPTMAPDAGQWLDSPGPTQDRPLYTPEESRPAARGFPVWLLAAAAIVTLLAGLSLVAVAGVMYMQRAPTVAVVIPPEQPVKPPVVTPTEVKPPVGEENPPIAVVETPTVLTPVTTPPKDPGKTAKIKDTTTGTTGTSTVTTPAVVTPVVVETPPPPPKAEQCVKFTPPATAKVGGDVVLKANLCLEDGTDVVLWYRPSGGTWQSRLMPKALGSHTAKLSLNSEYAAGLEVYVEAANGASKGSKSKPLVVAVSP